MNTALKPTHPNFQDLEGHRYGYLKVIRFVSSEKITLWECQCECGKIKTIVASRLRSGKTLSCGCYKKKLWNKLIYKHGGKGTPEYLAWKHLRARCHNTNGKFYYRYGGRGIKVCAHWNNFENFITDMGRKPMPKHSIDRINNDGNYEPSNCRWGTKEEQATNRSNAHKLAFLDEVLSVTEWATRLGISRKTLQTRITRGWSIERMLTQKVTKQQKESI